MKLLSIDTSTLTAGVAAWEDGRTVAERRARVTTHSDELLAMIDQALREAGWEPSSLDGVACVSGPGSFTGLRIGLATAKGLCFATGRPLVCVPTLQALAARAPDGRAAAVLDAHKQEVYAAIYRVAGGSPTLEAGEWVLPPSELPPKLGEYPLVIVGDGALRYREIVGVHRLLDDDGAPRPADVARLAAARLSDGDSDDLPSSGPHYVRASEAEIARMKSR
jgi:tRNA threonylcarbamoyladenosine biosynthesis protein TsaB